MQQSEWVKKILKKSPANRYKKHRKKRKKVSSLIKKYHFTKQNVINMLNHFKIFTLNDLAEYNSQNPYRIPYSVIRHLFGSWKQCKKHLNYDFTKNFKYDQQKIIRLASHFKLLSIKKYTQAQKLQPEIFPRISWIIRHFERFSNFKRIVQANILQDILTRFFQLKNKLGRYPTKAQCKKQRVQIDVLQQYWDKQELKQLVQYLEKEYDKQRRKKQCQRTNKIEVE